MKDLDQRARKAVSHFWSTRQRQNKNQGKAGTRDRGNRSAVTGGAHFDAFADLVSDILTDAGLPKGSVFRKKRVDVVLPGFFRPTKEWDLLAVHNNVLLAAVEFKALCGPSFGNNYNNRAEEAVGNATDLWTGYREGAFKPSPRPWLGYLLLLEDDVGSTRAVKVREPHFGVDEVFHDASYARRCELTCERLIRERLYDAACLILSNRAEALSGKFSEPSTDLSIKQFARGLAGQIHAYLRTE